MAFECTDRESWERDGNLKKDKIVILELKITLPEIQNSQKGLHSKLEAVERESLNLKINKEKLSKPKNKREKKRLEKRINLGGTVG